MGDTRKFCTVTGIYSSSDYGYEIPMNKGEMFPHCPNHGREVTWNLVRPA